MKTLYSIITLFLALIIANINANTQSADTALVNASFGYNSYTDPLNVEFNAHFDMAAQYYYWDFGDGQDTNGYFVYHKYDTTGIYNVCLTVTDTAGTKDTYCQTIEIKQNPPYFSSNELDFNYQVYAANNAIQMLLSPKLSNHSKDLKYFWNFNGEATSTKPEPVFKYNGDGVYTVSVSIRDDYFSNDDYFIKKAITIGKPSCVAMFDFNLHGDTVQFINKSSANTVKYYWSFGDNRHSIQKSPEHIYFKPGIYDVSLIAMDEGNVCMDVYHEKIRIGTPRCNAEFNYYIDSFSHRVFFKNKSLGRPDQALWIFGDGGVSRKMNPIHKFDHPGIYSTKLMILKDDPFCIDFVEEDLIISKRNNDLLSDFIFNVDGKTVNLVAKAKGNNLDYTWNMGNPNPKFREKSTILKGVVNDFTYNKDGIYNVCLTVRNTNSGWSHMKCKRVRIGTPLRECKAAFGHLLDSTDAGWTIKCADLSFTPGTIDHREWRLNGNAIGSEPVKNYEIPEGYHKLGLIIEDNKGCVSRKYKLINVGQSKGLKGAYAYDVLDTITLKATGYPVDFVGISHGDAAKLKWDFEGDDIWDDSTSTNPTYTYTEPGTYYPKLLVTDPNTGDVDIYVDTIQVGAQSSINALNESIAKVDVYPNPFSQFANVSYSINSRSNIDISLLNADGKLLKTIYSGDKPAGTHTLVISRGDLNNGLYLIKITTDKGKVTKPLLLFE